jgi:hypothetical protein
MEVSINFETELVIHLSLSWFSCPVLNVDEIELLFNLSTELLHLDLSVLTVLSSLDFHGLVRFFDVLKEMSFPSEELVPLGGGSSTSEVG